MRWMAEYEVSYVEKNDYLNRLAIFSEKYEKIRNQDPTKSYKLGLNQFSAMTWEEFSVVLGKKKYTGNASIPSYYCGGGDINTDFYDPSTFHFDLPTNYIFPKLN